MNLDIDEMKDKLRSVVKNTLRRLHERVDDATVKGHSVAGKGARVLKPFQPSLSMPEAPHAARLTAKKVLNAARKVYGGSTKAIGTARKTLSKSDSGLNVAMQKEVAFFDDNQYAFAYFMSQSVGRVLVEQDISHEHRATPGPLWYGELADCLISLFPRNIGEYSANDLLNMTSIWRGDIKNKVWKFMSDTNIEELDIWAEQYNIQNNEQDVEFETIVLDTGFKLAEQRDRLTVVDFERKVRRSLSQNNAPYILRTSLLPASQWEV